MKISGKLTDSNAYNDGIRGNSYLFSFPSLSPRLLLLNEPTNRSNNCPNVKLALVYLRRRKDSKKTF